MDSSIWGAGHDFYGTRAAEREGSPLGRRSR